MIEKAIHYDWGVVPTIRAFVKDDAFIKGLMGCFGSGKSSGCVQDLFRRACKQQPDFDNVRRTRFVIIRSSYIQLKDTTKKTIEEWLPFARWKEYEHTFYIDIKLNDGTVVYSEWLLRALDRPEQFSNLLSMELTATWINEAKETPKEIFEGIQGRVGRYPKKVFKDNKLIYAPTWSGVVMDTNPPDTDHWWYKFFEESKPIRCSSCRDVNNNFILYDKGKCPQCGDSEKGIPLSAIYKQPSGLSPEAENLKYLAENYYQNLMIGKDDDFIKVYIHGEYGYLKEGKPVFPNYRDNLHLWHEPLQPVQGLPLIIGMDMALMPTAIVTQYDPKGRVLILDEIHGEYMSAKEFGERLLKPLLMSKYRFYEHLVIGDPAGNQRSQVDSRTVYQELKRQGIKAKAAKTNSLHQRIGAVNFFLTRLIDGKPAFVLSPECKMLRKALNGEYKYRRMKVSEERYSDEPDKNKFSHFGDSLEYACLEHEMGAIGYRKPQEIQSSISNPVHSMAWT